AVDGDHRRKGRERERDRAAELRTGTTRTARMRMEVRDMDSVATAITMDEAKKLAKQWGQEDREEFIHMIVETGKELDALFAGDYPSVEGVNANDEAACDKLTDAMVEAYRFGLHGPSDYDEQAMEVLRFFASLVDGHLDDDHDPVLYGLIQAGL